MIKSVVFRLTNTIKSSLTISNKYQQFFATFDCNNCSKKTVLPECTACHRMVNYFNIFNIPEQYNVNEQHIAVKAKELQKEYHPDKHSTSVQQFLKQNMKNYSAYINEAKATLLDDLKRAIYMMQLRGVEVEASTQIHDNKFMMEMFMLQQEIEEASQDGCEQIKARIEDIMKNLQAQFDEFFKSEDMDKCKEFVFKYKYLHRALQNVKQRLNAIEAHQH